MNELLETNAKEDPAFLPSYDLTCPAKPSSARTWMDGMEFKHCPIKKSCVINTHEHEDAVKQREDCVKKNIVAGIDEPCYAHLKEKKELCKLLRKSKIKDKQHPNFNAEKWLS